MPLPNHCIGCDKETLVLENGVPYCARCYRKEIINVKPKANRKNPKTLRKSK